MAFKGASETLQLGGGSFLAGRSSRSCALWAEGGRDMPCVGVTAMMLHAASTSNSSRHSGLTHMTSKSHSQLQRHTTYMQYGHYHIP